jgi:hypothetical protein
MGFTGCGKTEFFEGDGLQAVRWSFYIFLKRQPPEPIRAS